MAVQSVLTTVAPASYDRAERWFIFGNPGFEPIHTQLTMESLTGNCLTAASG
ncbi:hypothetical protein [Leptothoe sp. PORK10 BA2]|uniref:hypothetical protein n=1 Tax=Leptothoe sp. PORK10 BA2 TaxID=3110254 RepID=UPI002B2038BC|nr:hypothetical protein [Leptothoe sp. PORK10 BA2]MEA5465968.1 hypothetical protein [Leptothoe sp. PORK10 BA2]